MAKPKKDEKREHRIDMEIVVDTYNEEECAMGWYCHLEDKITFPFNARVIKGIKISPLEKDEIVTVTEMADSDDCFETMYVMVESDGDEFGIPLEQIYPVDTDGEINSATLEAIEDWHYWVNMGYSF